MFLSPASVQLQRPSSVAGSGIWSRLLEAEAAPKGTKPTFFSSASESEIKPLRFFCQCECLLGCSFLPLETRSYFSLRSLVVTVPVPSLEGEGSSPSAENAYAAIAWKRETRIAGRFLVSLHTRLD